MIEGAIRAEAQLTTLATRVGATVEGLSLLANVGRLSGTGLETITGTMQRTERALKQGGAETSKAEIAFKALGITIRDASGNLLPMDQILLNSSRSLNNYRSGTDKAILSMTLFGRGGQMLLPVMKDLIENTDMMATASTESAERMEALEKIWIKVGIELDRSKKKMAEGLTPALEMIGKALLDVVKNSLGFNDGLNRLAQNKDFQKFVEYAAKALAWLADAIYASIKEIVEFVALLVNTGKYVISFENILEHFSRGDFAGGMKIYREEFRELGNEINAGAVKVAKSALGLGEAAMAGKGPFQKAMDEQIAIVHRRDAAIEESQKKFAATVATGFAPPRYGNEGRGGGSAVGPAQYGPKEKTAAEIQKEIAAAEAAGEASRRTATSLAKEWQKYEADFNKMIGAAQYSIKMLNESIASIEVVELPVDSVRAFSTTMLDASFASKSTEEKIAALDVAFGNLTTGSDISTKAMREFEAISRTAAYAAKDHAEQEKLRKTAMEAADWEKQVTILTAYHGALASATEMVVGAKAELMSMAMGTDKVSQALQALFKLQSSPVWKEMTDQERETVKYRLLQADAILKVVENTKLLFDLQQKFKAGTEAVRAGFIDQKTVDRITAINEQFPAMVISAEAAAEKVTLLNMAIKDDSVLGALAKEVEAFQIEAATLGLTDTQRQLYTVGIDRAKLALMTLDPAIRASIEAFLNQKEALLIAKDAMEQYLQTQQLIANAVRTAADYGQSFFESWADGMKGVSDWCKRVGQDLKRWLLDVLYELTIKKWVIQIAANVLGLGGNALGSMLSGATPNADIFSMLLGGVGIKNPFAPASAGGSIFNRLGGAAGGGGGFSTAVPAAAQMALTPSVGAAGAAGWMSAEGAGSYSAGYSAGYGAGQAFLPDIETRAFAPQWTPAEAGLGYELPQISSATLPSGYTVGPGGMVTLPINLIPNAPSGGILSNLQAYNPFNNMGWTSWGGSTAPVVSSGGWVSAEGGSSYAGMTGAGGFGPLGSSGYSVGGLLGGAAIGYAGGTLLAGLFGNERNQRSMQIGGTIGGAIGSFGGPLGSIVGSAVGSAIGSLFKKGGGPMTRQYGFSAGANLEEFGPDFSGVHKLVGTDAKVEQAFVDLSNTQTEKYNSIMKLMGRTGTAHFATYTSQDPRGTAQSGTHAVATVGGKLAYNLDTGLTLGRDPQVLADRVTLESERAVFAALQASDLPPAVAKIFGKFTASTMSAESIGIVENFGAAVGALVEKIRKQREKAAKDANAAINKASDSSRLEVGAPKTADLSTAASKLATSLSGSLDQATAKLGKSLETGISGVTAKLDEGSKAVAGSSVGLVVNLAQFGSNLATAGDSVSVDIEKVLPLGGKLSTTIGGAIGAVTDSFAAGADAIVAAGQNVANVLDPALDGVADSVDQLGDDLPPIVQHLIDVIDGTDEQIVKLSGLLPAVTAYINLMASDPLADAMELMKSQTDSLSTAFDDASANLQDVIDNFDGSAEAATNLSDAMGTFYQATVRLLAGLLQAKQNIDDNVANAQRSIEMTGMTPEEKREYLRQENIKLMGLMKETEDPTRKQYYADKIVSNITEAWGTLTPEEQKQQKGTYLQNLSQFREDADAQIDAAIEKTQNQMTQFITELGPLLTNAVDKMGTAAETQVTAAGTQTQAATAQVRAAGTPHTVIVRYAGPGEPGGG